MKRIDPLFRNIDEEDMAYNCACVCSGVNENNKDAKGWMWLPWNSCGCACDGTSINSSANSDMAQKKN